MQRLSDPTLTPPPPGFGIRLDGGLVSGGTLNALVANVGRYKQLRGEQPLSREEIEDSLCRELAKRYPGATNCDTEDRPFFADIDALSTVGDRTVWGPAFWRLLHTKRIEEEKQPGQWLRRFHERLDCPICRNHFGTLIEEIPPRYDDWLSWSVSIHNIVNRSLGKRTWDLEEAREFYGNQGH